MHEDDEFEPDYGPFEDELPKNDAMYIRESTKRYNKNSVLEAHIAECHQSDIENTNIKFSEDKYERWVNLMNGLLDVVSKELGCDTLQDLCNLADKNCVYPKHSEHIFQEKDLKLLSIFNATNEYVFEFGSKNIIVQSPYSIPFLLHWRILASLIQQTEMGENIISVEKIKSLRPVLSNYCYPRNWPSSDLRSKIRKDNRIKLTFGIHPRIVELENSSKLNEWISDLELMLKANRVVAVGECGLDNSGRKWDVEKQIKFFKNQIVIAVKRDLPLVIHCRGDERTDEMCLNTLVRLLPKHFKLHRHCFNGDEVMYRKWKTSFPNCKFGISPFILNDQKYPKFRSLVCNMKLKDIVLETDAPYLHSELEELGSPLMIKDI
ncbi:tatD [Mytilus coruscus]|uniref:TatD n=1 Tax=Mytilus coruscus TaxID=42192 RepID=A0A6J7ZU79_MYTCO|nr:tatD [Mytilus coruscus]